MERKVELSTKILYQITSKYFCAGLEHWFEDDRITEAAPIIKYMKTWPIDKVLDHCKIKHWKIERVG